MPQISLSRRSTEVGQTFRRTWSFSGVLQSNTTTVQQYAHDSWTQYKYWERTANYRALVRSNAILPTQPLDFRVHTKQGGDRISRTATVLYAGSSQISSQETRTYPGSAFARTDEATITAPTVSELNARLLAKQRDNEWNVPVFFAEARKTSDMVVQRAGHLVQLVRALRRGDANRFFDGLRATVEGTQRRRAVQQFNRHYGRRPSQAAANMWLEYAYGWTPFMGDVRNAVNTLMDMSDESSLLVGSTKARIRRTVPYNETPIWNTIDTYCQTNWSGSRCVVERRGTWYWEPKPGTIPAKLGLLNPLTVAWELLPFSFVADWFLPIGDYLAQLDTPFRVIHKGGAYGYRAEYRHLGVIQPKLGQGADVIASGTTRGTNVRVVRSAMTSIPNISMSDIPISTDLGSRRVASSLALLRTNLAGLSRRSTRGQREEFFLPWQDRR